MARWRGYTPEEKEARREADKQLRESANELLADPQRVEQMTQAMQRLPWTVRYSENNLALLYSQALARGIALSDVNGHREWRLRGRRVRKGERGLRIVAPTKKRDQEGQEQGKITGFRMVSVFDISQTVVLDEDAAPEQNPPSAESNAESQDSRRAAS